MKMRSPAVMRQGPPCPSAVSCCKCLGWVKPGSLDYWQRKCLINKSNLNYHLLGTFSRLLLSETGPRTAWSKPSRAAAAVSQLHFFKPCCISLLSIFRWGSHAMLSGERCLGFSGFPFPWVASPTRHACHGAWPYTSCSHLSLLIV